MNSTTICISFGLGVALSLAPTTTSTAHALPASTPTTISVVNQSATITSSQIATIESVLGVYAPMVTRAWHLPYPIITHSASELTVYLADSWDFDMPNGIFAVHYLYGKANIAVVNVPLLITYNKKVRWPKVTLLQAVTHEVAEALVSPNGDNEIADRLETQVMKVAGYSVAAFEVPRKGEVK